MLSFHGLRRDSGMIAEGDHSPSPQSSPGKGKGSFPLLHFLLPPGEENRGKGLHRERKIKEWVFIG
jgi:hypothetical protein